SHRSVDCGRRLCLDLLDEVEAALDVAEWKTTELREFEFPPFYPQEPLDGFVREAVADDLSWDSTDDRIGRNILGDHGACRDDGAIADIDPRHYVDVVPRP